jgi:hypothetical protein
LGIALFDYQEEKSSAEQGKASIMQRQ